MSCRLHSTSPEVRSWLSRDLKKKRAGSFIGEEIGSGADGCVHKLITSNEVLEVIKFDGSEGADLVQSIAHPAIVAPVHSYHWEGKLIARIYPYIKGETFVSQKSKFMELSSEKQFHFLLLLGEACKFLHERGVQHGDLNGRNVMSDRSFMQPFIIDFDRARSVESILPDRFKTFDEWRLISQWLDSTIAGSVSIQQKVFLDSCVEELKHHLQSHGREGIMDLYISFVRNCIDHVSVLEKIPSKL